MSIDPNKIMPKSSFLRITFGFILIILSIAPRTTAATIIFSDLLITSRYAPAIHYLAEAGIIQGYPDGTFRPDLNVNRAEFLKLVLESSEIQTDITTPTKFTDIDETAWYAKYVRKAAHQGWIKGYPDGTFRPAQNINKVEAIKIIGEVQKWDLPKDLSEQPFIDTKITDWFTPYIAYAKSKNLLEETTKTYIPETILSRARISEMMFRSFITAKSGVEIYSTSLITKYPASLYSREITPDTTTIVNYNTDFQPVTQKSYDPDFFDNITLDSNIPNTFYKNEIFLISGEINNGTYSQVFIFITPQSESIPQTNINFVAPVIDGKFSIPAYFENSGNFQFGIIPGDSGESKIMPISVLPTLPSLGTANPPSTPTTPVITYKNNQTTLGWQPGTNELKRISFIQESKTLTFYNRQNISSVPVDYPYFEPLIEGHTTMTVEKAKMGLEQPLQITSKWSNPAQKNFTAVTHQYAEVDDNAITHGTLPDTLTTGNEIIISGTAKVNLESKAAIITPDGLVEDININSSKPLISSFGQDIITANSTYTFKYTPSKSGTYIIEINNANGSAVINIPVYVSTGIPLLPDFFDLNKYESPVPTFNLSSFRTQLLAMINETRTEFGLPKVTIDSSLNQLAQLHSEDMRDRDFFGHINPDGKTPEDRRIAQGIPVTVGENLAIAPTIEYTHNGLMRSAVHRSNIIDPTWTKVGIGISQKEDGSLIVTEEFSLETYNEIFLNNAETDIINAINLERGNRGLSNLTPEYSIQHIANEWSSKMVEQNFFDFESPNGDSLSQMVADEIPTKNVQALILETVTVTNIQNELLRSEEALSSKWSKIGIGISSTTEGKLKTTALFSN